jgi:hypothetical protein
VDKISGRDARRVFPTAVSFPRTRESIFLPRAPCPRQNWIPAFAGMTAVEGVGRAHIRTIIPAHVGIHLPSANAVPETKLDSRLRGNDAVGGAGPAHTRGVTPAAVGLVPDLPISTGSFPRTRESPFGPWWRPSGTPARPQRRENRDSRLRGNDTVGVVRSCTSLPSHFPHGNDAGGVGRPGAKATAVTAATTHA